MKQQKEINIARNFAYCRWILSGSLLRRIAVEPAGVPARKARLRRPEASLRSVYKAMP